MEGFSRNRLVQQSSKAEPESIPWLVIASILQGQVCVRSTARVIAVLVSRLHLYYETLMLIHACFAL